MCVARLRKDESAEDEFVVRAAEAHGVPHRDRPRQLRRFGEPPGQSVPPAHQLLKEVGLQSPAKLLSCLVLDPASVAAFAGDGPINTDDHSYLEFSEERSFGRDSRPGNLAALLDVVPDYGSLIEDPPGTWPTGFADELDRAIECRRHLLLSTLEYYRGNTEMALREIWMADRLLPDDREVAYLGGTPS